MNDENPWVNALTFADVLRRTAEHHADRDALVFPWLNHRRSYAEFRADVRRAARALTVMQITWGIRGRFKSNIASRPKSANKRTYTGRSNWC